MKFGRKNSLDLSQRTCQLDWQRGSSRSAEIRFLVKLLLLQGLCCPFELSRRYRTRVGYKLRRSLEDARFGSGVRQRAVVAG